MHENVCPRGRRVSVMPSSDRENPRTANMPTRTQLSGARLLLGSIIATYRQKPTPSSSLTRTRRSSGLRWGLLCAQVRGPGARDGRRRTVGSSALQLAPCPLLCQRVASLLLHCTRRREPMAEVFSDLLQATLRNRDQNANPWSLLRGALTARVRRVAPYHIIAQMYALSAIIAV